MLGELVASDPSLKVRPVQAALLFLEFKAFGGHPFPYHLIVALISIAATVLLYLAIKEFGLERWLALAIAVIFGLSPSYSTDKFWVSSQQAGLCMAFALFGIYALLRSSRMEERQRRRWDVFAAIALILSILSYEVAIGLIVASLAEAGWRRYEAARTQPVQSIPGGGGIAGITLVLLVVGLVKYFMQTRMSAPRHWSFLGRLGNMTLHAAVQMFKFNFWSYRLGLPFKVFLLYQRSALSPLALWTGGAIALLVAVYVLQNMKRSALPSVRAALWMVLIGLFLFAIGYALFFPELRTDFSTAGINNRIEIASAVGGACTLVGVLSLVCSILRSQLLSRRVFSVAIGVICGMSCLVVSGIGSYWTTAASAQAQILQSISDLGPIPRGSVLLLDGFCKYRGPGVVFETDWDTSGAIQLALKDSSLVGDVVSSTTTFGTTAVDTTIYGAPEGHYPYGDHLFVYNVERNSMRGLPSQAAATGYFLAMNPTRTNRCPPGHEGEGAKIF